MLKSGIMESGSLINSKKGTPQGGVASPLLANIYLHYVLDLWFEKRFKKSSNRYMQLIRYSDDFVVLFENKVDAERFLKELKERLGKFKLSIAEDKTRLIEFGRNVYERCKRNKMKTSTFNFLGFTHYFAKSRKGKIIASHKTSKETLRRKLKVMKEWLRMMRTKAPFNEWLPKLKLKLVGHYNYFGISGNYRCVNQFYRKVVILIYRWMNRRSQKKSTSWMSFLRYIREIDPLPKPRIAVNLYTLGAKL